MQQLVDLYQWSLTPAVTIGWPISYIELVILVFNIVGVYLAARNTVWTAPICLVAITAYMCVCYSFRFYSDFFLQIYFFATNVWLWYSWSQRKKEKVIPVRNLNQTTLWATIGFWLIASWLLGTHIDSFFTVFVTTGLAVLSMFTGETYTYVHQAAAFPYVDAYTAIGQIIAMALMVRRYIENWHMWIVIDIVSIPMFYLKGGYGVSLMFLIFTGVAAYGLYQWKQIIKTQQSV